MHLVGGKLDLVLANPALRAVPFEQACAYAEENLEDMQGENIVGDDLSCHEVSAKDDTGIDLRAPQSPLCYAGCCSWWCLRWGTNQKQGWRKFSLRFRESWLNNGKKSRMQETH